MKLFQTLKKEECMTNLEQQIRKVLAEVKDHLVVDIHIQPQGAYSSIVIANDIAHPVLSDNPALRTTKNIRYRHGFGIQNMRQAVERNQGLIRFYEQNDRFICDILLLNVQSRNE